MKDYILAQTAYEAICGATGGKSPATGQLLPPWNNLPGRMKDAWYTAAEAVVLLALKKARDARLASSF